jgi:hypothetical protein
MKATELENWAAFEQALKDYWFFGDNVIPSGCLRPRWSGMGKKECRLAIFTVSSAPRLDLPSKLSQE